MNRNFKGIWIPAEIWLTKELTMQEKLFLVEIDSLDNEEGCFATNAHFSEFFGIGKTRVSLVIKSLIEKGFITSKIIYKDGTKQVEKRILHSNMRIDFNSHNSVTTDIENERGYLTKVKEGTQQKLNTPPQQKLKGNNTSFNNTNNINIYIADIRKLYPGTKTKKVADKKLPKLIKEYGVEQITRTVERYKQEVETKRNNGFKTLNYKNEGTFWNGGYMDYLDENYVEVINQPIQEEVKQYCDKCKNGWIMKPVGNDIVRVKCECNK